MSVIYVLIPIAMIIVAIGVAIFIWAVRSNQFEDIERQGMSILLDDEDEQPSASQRHRQQSPAQQSSQQKSPPQQQPTQTAHTDSDKSDQA